MSKSYGHRVRPDFTEELVGFALASYLTQLSFPDQNFSIEPF